MDRPTIALPDGAPERGPQARPRVVMLVGNPCVNDSRVVRAAEAVASMGYEAVVLATSTGREPPEEKRNGVVYRRIQARANAAPRVPAAVGPPPREPGVPRPAAGADRRPDQETARAAEPARGADKPAPAPAPGGAPAGARIPAIARTLLRRAIRKANRSGKLVLRRLKAGMQRVRSALRHAVVKAIRVVKAGLRRAESELRRIRADLRRVQAELRRAVTKTARSGRQIAAKQLWTKIETTRLNNLFLDELVALDPDVVHAHDLVTLPVASIGAGRTGARLIYDAHELEVHRNSRSGLLDKWLRYLTERRYIRKADAVVTVCDSIADHLARVYRVPRPRVVMNAPDGEGAGTYHRDLRSDLGLGPDTPLAVYVGRITVGRGIEQSVSALEHWPELHLALLGAVNPPTVAAASSLAEKLGVTERLHILPPVPPDAVVSYVASADVSVVPIQNVCLSYYYCLPNKLIESTIAGLPVVVSDFPEMRRFVELSGSGMIVDETDPRAIARALREVCEDRDRFCPDAERRRQIVEIYGWARQRSVLCDLYAELSVPPAAEPRPAETGEAGRGMEPLLSESTAPG